MAGLVRTSSDAQISLTAVDNWWAKWLAGGHQALVAQPRGRRPGEHQVLDTVASAAKRGIRWGVPLLASAAWTDNPGNLCGHST
ncbi:helix-turn-helix domain-containing protein, partial [Streptomyces sp900116325]|uniref:helix-turn-helix domain-containing protein n=1 Tax=Streptomyces sp. 900116325 TaxID=3154295 RepID=UPI0033D0A070